MEIRDPALLITAVMTTGVAVTFTAVVALRRNDSANRVWAVGYCTFAAAAWAAGLLPVVAADTGVDAADPSGPAAIAAGGFAFLPIALSWGTALLQGQRAHAEVVATALAVGCATWVGVASADGLDGARTAWLATQVLYGALGLLLAYRLLTGPLRANLNARLLAGLGVATPVALGTGLVALDTPEPAYDAAAFVLGTLLVVSAPCLTALRVEQSANWWATRDEHVRRDLLGVLSRTAFLQDGEDRLQRAARTGLRTHLTEVRIEGLSEINTAFGRDAGDAALGFAARVLATYAPPTALLGHLGAGHFVIHSAEDGALVESAVRTGLLRDPLPPLLPTRFDVTISVTVAEPTSTLTELLGPAAPTSPHPPEPHRESTPPSQDRDPAHDVSAADVPRSHR